MVREEARQDYIVIIVNHQIRIWN